MQESKYRKCVGIVLFNDERKVLVGKRRDYSSEAWQLPQGGVDEGESYEQALFREMTEEIGTDKAEIIAPLPNRLRYDLPQKLQGKLWGGKFVGQEQQWFLMHFIGEEDDININTEEPEFVEYRWVPLPQCIDLIVEFKRDVYKKLIEHFAPIIDNYEIK